MILTITSCLPKKREEEDKQIEHFDSYITDIYTFLQYNPSNQI